MKTNTRGDTIVEVLFAMAIIGLVLTGAYKMATLNTQTTRRTQERSEALKIAEGQLEAMKSLPPEERTQLFTQTNFCISAGSQEVVVPGGSQDCQIGLYSSTITRQLNATRHYFVITVSWIPPGGRSVNPLEVKISYGYQP
jgi:prepilin-type N-terminal cleavage/methylation domain-containing protein